MMRRLGFLGIVVLFIVLVSLYPFILTSSEAQTSNNETVARRVIEDIWNGANPDSIVELYEMSFTWYWPDSTTITTAPRVWNLFYVTPLREAVPDIEFVIENIATTDNIVLVNFTATGTFENPYQFLSTANPFTGLHTTIEPTGEEVVWDGVFIYHFEDGKIVEEEWYYDGSILATLGGIEFVITAE